MNEKTGGRVSAADVRELLIAELAAILRIDRADIETSKPFDEYGLDSTDSVVVVGLVEERIGIELEPELMLRYRTIDEVIGSLKERGTIA